ncbi:MAG: HAD hydrolase-like protein [Planctomycetota bacterium]|nr:HAD hydrolase-like protein [Planctomycetota bacterium]MDA1213928.1 HAD hydrolase-like protein [Planctomycetota bacterium]
MAENPLTDMQKQHDFLVAIDSDGCAFDSMEIKHKECFIPNFIKFMGLQPISKYAREACEFTNLYSKTRGANRFPAYLLALDLLEQRAEVIARKAAIPRLQSVRDWVKRETKLSSGTVRAEADKTNDADLIRAADWSAAVDATIKETVHGVPPFPGVAESLQKMTGKADLIVCSATPTPALNKEWQEHKIDGFVSAICGQEVGSKAEILTEAQKKGYAKDKVLMIGDAPGDMKAAKSVGVMFYPINPGHEEKSWDRFINEACARFFSGTYAGDYEAQLIAEFDRYLPEHPPWKK